MRNRKVPNKSSITIHAYQYVLSDHLIVIESHYCVGATDSPDGNYQTAPLNSSLFSHFLPPNHNPLRFATPHYNFFYYTSSFLSFQLTILTFTLYFSPSSSYSLFILLLLYYNPKTYALVIIAGCHHTP